MEEQLIVATALPSIILLIGVIVYWRIQMKKGVRPKTTKKFNSPC